MAFSYLDHNAGTGLSEGVLDAMMPYLRQQQGNPSSSHRFGRFGKSAMDTARQQVADLVNVEPAQVIFTSGGTESNNQVFAGLREQFSDGELLINPTEHPAVLEPVYRLQKHGFTVLKMPVSDQGVVAVEAAQTMMSPQTRLVSVMLANNETGSLQPVATLAALCKQRQIPMHTDAVQAVGKIPVDFRQLGVQLMSLSAHKMGGPKGIGALIVDKSIDWPAFILGGGQEDDHRSGTENVAAIVGFGVAADHARQTLEHYGKHCRELRDTLEQRLKVLPGVTIFAEHAERLPNTVFFALQGYDSDSLLMALDRQGFSVSSGSACGTGQQTPSHVLTAMGIDDLTALGAVRVSVSADNTIDEIERLAEAIAKEANRFSHLMNR
ncbi:cysteine desulfurase family protein [Methylophaga lonarensis]|uniref:cysteine desulfurase family protein n=1 Tax=Methylophaga lonarensis TaxID=999151 RepID=UPI003D2ACF23